MLAGRVEGQERSDAAEDSQDEFRHTWRLRQDGTRRDNADIGPGKYGGKVDELSIPGWRRRGRRRRWRDGAR